MTTATQTTFESEKALGTKVPFENIQEPGCYICNWSGHLLRVPEDGIAPGRSPLLNLVGNEPLFVTKPRLLRELLVAAASITVWSSCRRRSAPTCGSAGGCIGASV
jgi:hypothetical protein